MGCAVCSNNLNNNAGYNVNSTDIRFYNNTESSIVSSNDKPIQKNKFHLHNTVINSRSLFMSNKKQKTHNSVFSTNKDSNKTLPSVLTSYHTVSSLMTPCMSMLKIINQARTNPLSLIDKIEHLKHNIYYNKVHHSHYLQVEDQRILLHKGIESFDNCISYLKSLSTQPPVKPLVPKEELKMPFPSHCSSICIEANYLKNLILLKSSEIEPQYTILDFHYDICVCDSEISTLLQIVDDTDDNYQRRKNIFNINAHFIGISEGKLHDNKLSCYYLLFAK